VEVVAEGIENKKNARVCLNVLQVRENKIEAYKIMMTRN
jgi:hypothetical protein